MNEKLTSKVFAKMIDHSLLHPSLTEAELKEECEIAKKYHVYSVSVKPCHVKLAKACCEGSDVEVGTVMSFPHGNAATEIKLAETKQVLADGATEVDMVINIGKAMAEDWDYIDKEIGAIVALTNQAGALLKVIFENDMLNAAGEKAASYKIKLCEICSKHKVGFVKTSTGYCYVKEPDGRWSYEGATDEDLKLMRRHSAPEVQVKAAGKVGTLEDMLRIREIGVTRIGTKNTIQIMKDAVERFGE